MNKKIDLYKLDTVDANNLVNYYRQDLSEANYRNIVLSEQIKNYKNFIEILKKEHPEIFESEEKNDGTTTETKLRPIKK